MTILAPHFCTQQTVTLNDTNPSKYLSRLGYTGLETYFYSNLQNFASGFNLNSQIAMSNSQLVFPLLYSFKHCRVNLMAIVSCVWNLIHPFPFLRQRTCSILLSFVSRNVLWHGKSFCYEVLQLSHCFY